MANAKRVTETTTPKTTRRIKAGFVKTFDGSRIIRITDYQKSLTDFPSYCRKVMADDGNPYLSNCVTVTPPCGCEVIGHGSLQFPLSIRFCKAHQTVKG